MGVTEVIASLVIGLPATVLAVLAYMRGSKADDAAQETAANAQVYAGYGGLLENLQDDNADLRRRLVICEAALLRNRQGRREN